LKIDRVLRFRIWIALVAILLLGQPLWLFFRLASAQLFLGLFFLLACIFGFAALLWTTPSDAIRLKVATSFWTILAGTVWLQTWAVAVIGPPAAPDTLLWTAGVVATTILCMGLLWRSDKSLWWATLFAWNPLTLLGPTLLSAA